jgi:hypothetical protein
MNEQMISTLTLDPDGEVTRYDPTAGAIRIHASEAAERAAIRAKNSDALERAITDKLEAQRDFAADYTAKFEHGGDRRSDTFQDDRSVVLKPDTYCQRFGFHIRTVQRWAERLLDPERFDVERSERLAKVWRLIEMEQAANFSSETCEWYTPAMYIEHVREALGGIDLDPASSPQANEIVKASRFFTKEDDGLEQDWNASRVFVNPPYGRHEEHKSLAGAFCVKALQEYESGRVDACIILVNSCHSQQWQAPLYEHTVCFVDHRIQFSAMDGEENKNPTFQNIFVYLGNDVVRFATVFSGIGYVMSPWRPSKDSRVSTEADRTR